MTWSICRGKQKTETRLISLLLVTVLVLTLIPAVTAANVNDYEVLWSTLDMETVENAGEEVFCTMGEPLKENWYLRSLTVYHWNNGQGAEPGTIRIYDEDTGAWIFQLHARGRGTEDAENVYWDVFPNVVLQAGHTYSIYDSDSTTWSMDPDHTRLAFELRGKVIDGTGFEDVSLDDYFSSPVVWATNQEPVITTGTSETTFSPNAPCIRGQAVTFLWRAAGCPEPKSNAAPFADVERNSYYSKAASWAVENGITTGTFETTFQPLESCTRAQIVTFLWRLAGKPAVDGEKPFADIPDGQYYTDAVLWAAEKGITMGTSETEFSPEAPCTRAQIMTFLYRMMQNVGIAWKSEFRYVHDPRNNPSAMEDIVVNPDAVYGFSPSLDGSLKQYAGEDWSNPEVVEAGRQERVAYHESMKELYDLIAEMRSQRCTVEEIARAISTRRNQIRLEFYADDPEGLERVKQRNLEVYGHEEGPLPEELFEKYGSWTNVLVKALSVNSGMDACLGLYDDYYSLYVAAGQVQE